MLRHMLIAAAVLCMPLAANAQQGMADGEREISGRGAGASADQPDAVVDQRLLYDGWRARDLLGEAAADSSGRQIGVIQDLLIDANGRIVAAVVEGGGIVGVPDTVFRIPWRFVRDVRGGGVRVDLSPDGRLPEYTFSTPNGVPTWPREYRITEVIGDAVRLRTGYLYGTVTDVVFDRAGRTTFVIVAGTPHLGTALGTVAFPFNGMTGAWDPGASYFGLPFVVPEQARQAAIPVDRSRFDSGAATGGG